MKRQVEEETPDRPWKKIRVMKVELIPYQEVLKDMQAQMEEMARSIHQLQQHINSHNTCFVPAPPPVKIEPEQPEPEVPLAACPIQLEPVSSDALYTPKSPDPDCSDEYDPSDSYSTEASPSSSGGWEDEPDYSVCRNCLYCEPCFWLLPYWQQEGLRYFTQSGTRETIGLLRNGPGGFPHSCDSCISCPLCVRSARRLCEQHYDPRPNVERYLNQQADLCAHLLIRRGSVGNQD